jgi:hypothetical protein
LCGANGSLQKQSAARQGSGNQELPPIDLRWGCCCILDDYRYSHLIFLIAGTPRRFRSIL